MSKCAPPGATRTLATPSSERRSLRSQIFRRNEFWPVNNPPVLFFRFAVVSECFFSHCVYEFLPRNLVFRFPKPDVKFSPFVILAILQVRLRIRFDDPVERQTRISRIGKDDRYRIVYGIRLPKRVMSVSSCHFRRKLALRLS